MLLRNFRTAVVNQEPIVTPQELKLVSEIWSNRLRGKTRPLLMSWTQFQRFIHDLPEPLGMLRVSDASEQQLADAFIKQEDVRTCSPVHACMHACMRIHCMRVWGCA